MGFFERLFGEPVLVHPLFVMRNIFPQRPESTTPAHQDYVHIQGTPDTYTVWIPWATFRSSRGACRSPPARTGMGSGSSA